MKKILLAGLVGAFALGSADAAPRTETNAEMASVKTVNVLKDTRVIKTEKLSKNVTLQILADKQGRQFKRLVTVGKDSRINPDAVTGQSREVSEDGYVFVENFEGWDQTDPFWLPEGWSVKDASESGDQEKWMISLPNYVYGVSGLDGDFMSVNYSDDFKDEWLVSPEIAVESGMELSFRTVNDGVWYYSMENVDWDLLEYIGDKILAYDLRVMVSEDGGETWNLLKSLAEDFVDDSFSELYRSALYNMQTVRVSLGAYAGKTVKVGFQYVGTDGNLHMIDDVKVGLPSLELSYMNPTCGLFYGMSPAGYTLNHSILACPVYRPITWTNLSWNEGATYTWEYFGPENEWVTDDNQEELTVIYKPDYSSEFTTRNNLYNTPVLKGESPVATPGVYTRGEYLQAGGKAEFELTDATSGEKIIEPFGLGVIDPTAEGTATYTDTLVPIFGYSGDADSYWTNYTFGDDGDEQNWSHLEGYMNFFYASEAPVVIDGVWATAYGIINDGAMFKAEILPLGDDSVPGESIATAYCGGDKVSKIKTGGASDFLTLNFRFDEPVVMTSEQCQAYMVRISGFRDADNVQYFSPVLSEHENADGAAYGWVSKEISMDGNVRESYTPVLYYTGLAQAFYIMLDAYYPWLEGEEECKIVPGQTAAHALDSYHDGEDLTVENLPAWLSADVSGRYGQTTLNLTASSEAQGEAVVFVKGHGVSQEVKVVADPSGILEIDSDAAGVSEIHTLQGIRVSDASAPGIYVVRMADGKVRKAVKK